MISWNKYKKATVKGCLLLFLGGKMKPIRCDLPRDLDQIKIHVMADLHIGDKHCDIELIKDRIKNVKETSNAFLILNGDIINNATKTSVSDCYAEELTPMEQLERFCSLFDPVRDKILALTSGNHENRTYNKEGVDLTYLTAKQLGIQERYSKTSAILFVRFGELSNGVKETNGSGKIRKVCYTIYTTHGSGGGRKEGAKVIRLADMASIVDADIYIHSHTHLPVVMKQSFFRTDSKNSTVYPVNKLFVNTAAAMNYGGYGEAFEYKPGSKDTPVIILNGKRKEANATL